MTMRFKPVIVTSYSTGGSGPEDADSFEFVSTGNTEDPEAVEEFIIDDDPARHTQASDDKHKDWIDLATMSPPIYRDETDVDFDIAGIF
jgi:hypothetical protein